MPTITAIVQRFRAWLDSLFSESETTRLAEKTRQELDEIDRRNVEVIDGYGNNEIDTASPAARLIGTPRKRTIFAGEVMVWTTAAAGIECRRVGRSRDATFRGPSRWRLLS